MLKFFIIIIANFLFFLNIAFSSSIAVGAGGITPHFSASKKNYCNQWNNTGIIVNKTYYLTVKGERYGATIMTGNDSICSEINGAFLHYQFYKGDTFDYGLAIGGYAFDYDNWEKHAEKTPSAIAAPEPVQIKIGQNDIVPVLALELGIKLIKSKQWSLKLVNLFTPIIFNHSLALQYDF